MDSVENFRIHFEHAPFSMQLLSPSGKTLAVNRAWKALWKIPEDIIQNYILKEYNVGSDPQLDLKGIGEVIRRGLTGEVVEIPPILYVPQETGISGDPKWVTGFMYPIKDKTGKLVEVVLTHQDITAKTIAEQALKKSRDELQTALNARDEFISICSHELKTPITSIKLQFQLAEKMLNDGDERVASKENLTKRIITTNRQLDRMTRLIDEMLDITRINTGKLQMEKKSINLKDLLEESLSRFTTQLEIAGIETTTDFPEGNWNVTGDRFRLEQVISNIITNTLKYGEGNPFVVRLRQRENFVRMEFSDRGIGIRPEDTERIFNRFERVTSATNISGMGLGLFISRQIVLAHNGRIWAEDNKPRGTTFVVEIPLS